MYQKPITILSIDGGGVRGIIPGVFLDHLESELQNLEKDPAVRLADYFDVISGTSTGGITATMLSSPDKHGRPLKSAKDIVKFYKDNCPNIFKRRLFSSAPNEAFAGEIDELNEGEIPATELTRIVIKTPIYNGKFLHDLLRDTLGKKRLHDITLTKLVIPAYDSKKLKPVIFSSYEVDNGKKECNALLSDICISTSAAPVYLPAHEFCNEGHDFNMISGVVASNNPTLVAITEAVKKRSVENVKGAKIDLNSVPLLVLSLGTFDHREEKYNAELLNSFRSYNWVVYPLWKIFWDADHPLIDILFDANTDMVDKYCTMFFESFRDPNRFLRIQDYNLPKELAAMDNGSPENLDKLEQYARDTLKKPVTRLNPATFERSVDGNNAETYADALKKFARKLYEIKHKQ